VNSRFTNRN